MFKHAHVPDFRHRPFERNLVGLKERMEAHHAKANRAFPHRGVACPAKIFRSIVDEILQNIIEEAHDVLNKTGVFFPFGILLNIKRREAADSRPILAEPVDTRRQGDLGTKVRGFNFKSAEFLVQRQCLVHMIDILDAKMNLMDIALNEDQEPGKFTNRHNYFRIPLLKKDEPE